jgi:hypothetical protein
LVPYAGIAGVEVEGDWGEHKELGQNVTDYGRNGLLFNILFFVDVE